MVATDANKTRKSGPVGSHRVGEKQKGGVKRSHRTISEEQRTLPDAWFIIVDQTMMKNDYTQGVFVMLCLGFTYHKVRIGMNYTGTV